MSDNRYYVNSTGRSASTLRTTPTRVLDPGLSSPPANGAFHYEGNLAEFSKLINDYGG
jgi:hypothetical protein